MSQVITIGWGGEGPGGAKARRQCLVISDMLSRVCYPRIQEFG